jgi:hypothetical protein
MLRQKLIIPLIAAAAFGGYMVYDKIDLGNLKRGQQPVTDSQILATKKLASAPAPTPVFQPIPSFESVFRFDVYPNWVKNNWGRVSTSPSETGLTGMRVAMVSGVEPTDISGALTYYFDDTHRVQRIQFVGRTDDASRLVAFVTTQHGMQTFKSLDAGFYLAKKGRKSTGFLKLSHPVAIHSRRPGQVLVTMELLAPSSPFGLSPSADTLVRSEVK